MPEYPALQGIRCRVAMVSADVGWSRRGAWRLHNLSTQLVLGVSVLVSSLVLAVGALSIYTLHTYVTAMSDNEVRHSLAVFQHMYDGSLASAARHAGLSGLTGQAPGTIIAVIRGGRVAESTMFTDTGPGQPPAAALTSLESLGPLGAASPRSAGLGELGTYRVAGVDAGLGVQLISAVSMAAANQMIATKTFAVVVVMIVAALGAAAGTLLLVSRALRPLHRVADIAARASRIPLGETGHRITMRVRQADSTPDNEMGIVGDALNRLLSSVDDGLAARGRAERRLRRFLSDASHELRTPLASIRGYAELTRQDGAALPEATEYALARIEAESCRMSALVDNMLLLSRLDEGRALEPSRLDLGALVSDAISDAAVNAPSHRYVAELPAMPIWVLGDAAGLHQVAMNLLTNVGIHTPPGVTAVVSLRVLNGSDVAELEVSDNGPGIDQALLPDVFDRFVRADASGSHGTPGTGLGLAIVKAIAEAHDGSISVNSHEGATTFRVRLPLADPVTVVADNK